MLTVVPDHIDAGADEMTGRSVSLLDELVGEGARGMLAAALEAEVAAYIDAHTDQVEEGGRRLVVRNGHHAPRQVLTGAGAVEVLAPRLHRSCKISDLGDRPSEILKQLQGPVSTPAAARTRWPGHMQMVVGPERTLGVFSSSNAPGLPDEIYFSVVQRKVVSPNDFTDTDQIRDRLAAFENRYNPIAAPFDWGFARRDLRDLLRRIAQHDQDHSDHRQAA